MISPGEIWLADIPYTDQRASKRRPVLILWLDAADAVVAVVTSAAPRSPTDIALTDWKASGLVFHRQSVSLASIAWNNLSCCTSSEDYPQPMRCD
jgi:mRNA-degrading endonuclease toxin of MazEF toxin-antitoxin module